MLFVVPLPPPWAGVEQISSLLVGSELKARFDLRILKSNVRSSNAAKGAWDLRGIIRVLSIAAQLTFRLVFQRPRVVYMTLSQNASGLARDVAYLKACRLFGVPVVAHLHGSKLPEYLQSLSGPVRRYFVRNLQRIHTVVVCSNSIAQDVLPMLPGVDVRVVYNACPPSSSKSRRLIGEKSAPVIAYMGHLSVAKGFYDLLAAAEAVLKKYPGARFEFAGERLDVERNVSSVVKDASSGWDKWLELLKKYPKNFHLHGIVTGKKKEEFFAAADIFVQPSYAEAFPVAVLEAMGAGLPVIMTPVGALPEVFRDDEHGFFVRSGDVAGMVEKIFLLIENAELRSRIGATNQTVTDRFSIEKMANEMAHIFEKASA